MNEQPEIFTAWITTDALSVGIETVKACVRADDHPDWLRLPGVYGIFVCGGEGKQWHRTREGAIARAQKIRDARVASLERHTAKLRAMTFDDTPRET